MTRPADPPSPESLLAQREWIRAIARSLVGDENAVDDVEQQTWLTVMRNRRPVESVRGWLRRVVKSAALDEHRAASRRHAREEASARSESLPPTDHLAAQAEAQRVVAQAVTGLPEPYRTTVLLRYFEELSLDEVAARMAVPLETVRTRLRRAHALLREALDREFGDRRKWAVVLLPLTRPRHWVPIGAATGGALLMATKTKALAVAAAVLALAAGVWWTATKDESDAKPAASSETASAVAAPAPSKRVVAKPEEAPPAETGLRLAVDVVDSAGRPVGGARVAMTALRRDPLVSSDNDWGGWFSRCLSRRAPVPPAKTATANESGAADVVGLAPGEWRLVVDAAGFADADERIVVDAAPARRRVVLVPGCELSGVVLSPAGAPAAGADVYAGKRRTVADPAGRFRFAGLHAGHVELSAGAAGGALQQCFSVTVPDVREVTLRLAGGCAFRGRVVDDATGAPIGGARVVVVAVRYDDLPRMLHWGAESASAADGAFAFDDLPQGQPYALAAFKDGWAACRDGKAALPPFATLTPGGTLTVELRMQRGGLVRGRVLRADGSPVTGATVDVLSRSASQGLTSSENATTGADGGFVLRAPLGPGLLRATSAGLRQRGLPKDVWSPVRAGDIPPACRVEVKADGDTSLDVVVDAAPETATRSTVAGVVRREDGGPVAGALVRANSGGERVASADGTFRFDGLTGTRQILRAAAPGCAPGHCEVDVPDEGVREGVEIVLAPERTIEGRVVGPDGAAVAGADITVVATASSELDQASAATTGDDGTFVVHGLTPGDWKLYARAAGLWGDEVKANAGESKVVLRLARTQSIAGTVVDSATGAPLPGIRVSANYTTYRSGWALYRSAATDAAGRFEITNLAPDSFNLWFGGEGDVDDHVGRSLKEVRAGTSDLHVPMERGTTIDGKVVDAGGNAVPGGTVAAFGPKAGPTPGLRVRLVNVGRDGRFRLPGLAPGAYDVEATPTDAAGQPTTPVRAADVPAGTSDVVLTTRPSVVIEGRLVLDDGSPLPQGPGFLELRTLHPNGSMKSSTGVASMWASDGSFRTQALDPAETYDLVMTQVPGKMGGIVRGVRPGATGVVIVVRDGARIEGRVLDASGNPVPPGTQVSAHSVQGEPWPQVPGRTAFGKTGADGRFTLIGLGDDKFRVYAGGHPDDFIEASAPQPVAAGTRNVEFRLERGVTIAGRVLDRKGQVVRGMFVQAERHGSPVQVDREGRFAIHALKPGTMRLHGQIGDRIVDLGETQAPAEGLELTVKDD